MGMAASQARLLTITARLADNELRSQTINNAKMRLATESSQASENYITALNDANLMFSNYDSTGAERAQLLTFNALTAYSSYNNQYGLVNSSGQILVNETEAATFEAANGNLNAYLKSHGLEFSTTYFKQLGTIQNPNYPEPFNSINSERLQEMYEASDSYENSIEFKQYTDYAKAFASATSALQTGTKQILQSYMLYQGNTPNLKNTENGIELDISAPGDSHVSNQILAKEFKSAFEKVDKKANPNAEENTKTYSIDNLKKLGLTEKGEAIIDEIINSVSYQGSNGIIQQRLASNYDNTKKDEHGNVIETLTFTDDIGATFTLTKDHTGNISITLPPGPDTTATGYDPKEDWYEYSATSTTGFRSWAAAINAITYEDKETEKNGKPINFKVDVNGKGKPEKVYAIETFSDPDDFKAALNSLAESIYNTITANEEAMSYSKFADEMLSWREGNSTDFNTAGIDINKILKNGQTYIQVLDQYKIAKDNYLGFIEKDYKPSVNEKSALETALEKGLITINELSDVDKVLRLCTNKEVGKITLTDNYKTVVNEFIVNHLIEEYGEPKYAWVDENDTNNTENADAKAQWYTNLFNRMKQGYKVLENGLASSSQWIEYALESGLVTMEQVDKSFNWKSLDYKSCARITEETDNSDKVAKAEAQYNRAMKDIDAKDSIYDIELKNIDTEHTALQTEYDTIKGVITKNIDRTFKFNQNG